MTVEQALIHLHSRFTLNVTTLYAEAASAKSYLERERMAARIKTWEQSRDEVEAIARRIGVPYAAEF
jgi:hypothetical protein